MTKKSNRKAAAARAKKYFHKTKSRGLRRLSVWVCAENTGFFDAVRRLDLSHPLTERFTEAEWIAFYRAQEVADGLLGASPAGATEVLNVTLNAEFEEPGSVVRIAVTSGSKVEILGAGCGNVPILMGERAIKEPEASVLAKTDDTHIALTSETDQADVELDSDVQAACEPSIGPNAFASVEEVAMNAPATPAPITVIATGILTPSLVPCEVTVDRQMNLFA